MKLLTCRGVLVEDLLQTCMADADTDGDEARTLWPLQAAAVSDRIDFGPRDGHKLLTLQGTVPRQTSLNGRTGRSTGRSTGR